MSTHSIRTYLNYCDDNRHIFPILAPCVFFVPNFSVCFFLPSSFNDLWLFEFAVIVVYFWYSVFFFALLTSTTNPHHINTMPYLSEFWISFFSFSFWNAHSVFAYLYLCTAILWWKKERSNYRDTKKKKNRRKIVKEFGFIWFLCMHISYLSYFALITHLNPIRTSREKEETNSHQYEFSHCECARATAI